MSRPGLVAPISAILVAGLAMWDAWVAYRDNPTRRNLSALLIRIVAFGAAVQTGAPSLSANVRALLETAAQALIGDVSQVRRLIHGL